MNDPHAIFFYVHTYGVWDAEMSDCLHIISIKIRIEPATKTQRERGKRKHQQQKKCDQII